MTRRWLAVVFATAGVGACSLLHDTSGFSGGIRGDAAPGDANVPSDSAADAGGGEDCTNGVDDNGDGLADCADPACTTIGYACSSVPDGWGGPYAMTTGTTPLPCAAPFETIGVEGHDALQKSACKCTCGPSDVGGCSTANLYVGLDPGGCETGSGYTLSVACTDLVTSGGVDAHTTKTSGGTCPPNDTASSDATWGTSLRACGTSTTFPTGGCTGTARCLPPAPAGFAPGQCIASDGDVPCPTGFPNKHVAYLGASCGCTCAPAACAATVYKGPGCTGASYVVGSECFFYGPLGSARAGGPSSSFCAAKATTPNEAPVPALPKTLCCSG